MSMSNNPADPGPWDAPALPQQYTIQSGDTLYNLATAAYGEANAEVGVTLIEDANPGIIPTDLQVGQQITIPVFGDV